MRVIENRLRRASDRNPAQFGLNLSSKDDAQHERVDALERELSGARDALAQARVDCELLREANAHLVHATFGAQDQTEAAENANRRQKIFLSMLAHELKNPIAAILTANNFMRAVGQLSPRAERMVAIVGRQAAHVHRLVDDLLDMARISTGKVSLKMSMVSLHEVVESAVELSTPVLTERRHCVVIDFPAKTLVVNGDMVRLTQLFSNLIINASKFSNQELPILVTGRACGQTVVVSVKDAGIGIDPADQTRIFDMFTQAQDNAEHGAASGLGIGLALVKNIAEMHGGSVRVASDGAGRGSEFTVVLPLP